MQSNPTHYLSLYPTEMNHCGEDTVLYLVMFPVCWFVPLSVPARTLVCVRVRVFLFLPPSPHLQIPATNMHKMIGEQKTTMT